MHRFTLRARTRTVTSEEDRELTEEHVCKYVLFGLLAVIFLSGSLFMFWRQRVDKDLCVRLAEHPCRDHWNCDWFPGTSARCQVRSVLWWPAFLSLLVGIPCWVISSCYVILEGRGNSSNLRLSSVVTGYVVWGVVFIAWLFALWYVSGSGTALVFLIIIAVILSFALVWWLIWICCMCVENRHKKKLLDRPKKSLSRSSPPSCSSSTYMSTSSYSSSSV